MRGVRRRALALVLSVGATLLAALPAGAQETLPETDLAIYGDFPSVSAGVVLFGEQLADMNVDQTKIDTYLNGGVPPENAPPAWSEPNTDPGPEDPEIPEITAARATTAGYPMYQVLWQWKDSLGTPFVLRRGYYNAATDRGFGFDKVYWKHNLTERAVMATTKWPRIRTHIGGTTWNYDTDVLRVRCSGWGPWRTCKVVEKKVVRAGHDFRKNHAGADAKAFGIVTAFCLGTVRCPDWVKNSVNI